MSSTIDTSGLNSEDLKILESVAKSLRNQKTKTDETADWIRQLNAWAASHPKMTHQADDQRESLYDRESK